MAKRSIRTALTPSRPLEAILWDTADKMRGNLEVSEYKHVVLGLVFLKYISDAFEQRHAYLVTATADASSDYFISDPRAPTSRERVARRISV